MLDTAYKGVPEVSRINLSISNDEGGLRVFCRLLYILGPGKPSEENVGIRGRSRRRRERKKEKKIEPEKLSADV